MSRHCFVSKVIWACLALVVGGCGSPQANPRPVVPSGASNATPNREQAIKISRNDLFFDGKVPATGDALGITPDAIRGAWRAATPAGEVVLVFGDGNVPAWTFDDKGGTIDNADGSACWYLFGTVKAAAPWGLEPSERYGWISWPGEAERRLVELRLVRADLLHVKGFTPAAGGVQFDVVLVKSLGDGRGTWNQYGMHRLTGLTTNELVDVLPADDPTIKAESPADFAGDWLARQNGSEVSLHIADHRVLSGRREGGESVVIQESEAPRQWSWMDEYDSDEGCLRIKEHAAFLRLTQGGRLLYRHFGDHGPGGEGGRTIDVLFVRATPTE